MKKPFSLSYMVLASTFFLAPFAQANIIIATPNPPQLPAPVETSITGNIEITPAGRLSYNAAVGALVPTVILVDTPASITIDPNNTQGAAIDSTGGGLKFSAIAITTPSAVVSVGQNSTIKAGALITGGDGITVSGAQATIVNSGTITATESAVNIVAGATKTTIYNQQAGTLNLLVGSVLGKPTVLIDGKSAILSNAGTITADSRQPSNAIALNGASGVFTNYPTGVVSQVNPAVGAAAITVSGTPVVITNSGQITSAGGAGISLAATAQNVAINNNQGGTIQGGKGPGILIGVGATGASIANTAMITSTGSDGITVNEHFNALINYVGGVIQTKQANTSAINLAAPLVGNIMNNGIIEGVGDNTAGITIKSVLNGSITNTASGIIRSEAGAGNNAQGLLIQGTFFTIDNSGTIEATGKNGISIFIDKAATVGTINNAGTIQSVDHSAIYLSGSITQINNTGTIKSTSRTNPTIFVNENGITLPGGLINNGNISALAGQTVIDLSNAKNNTTIPLTQNSGTITGNVFLASSGGNVFTQNGGTIDGDVSAVEPTPQVNTLNLNGGIITGTLFLGNQGAGKQGDRLNLSGTIVDRVQGGNSKNTFNISGGQINTALVGSGVVGDVLNINNTFSTNAAISNIEIINVKAGTFTVNGTIATLPTTYNVLAGATLVANNPGIRGQNINNLGSFVINQNINVGGTFDNGGSLLVSNGTTLTTDHFINKAGSTYVVEIADVGDYGAITVGGGGAKLLAGSVVKVQLTGAGTFIPLGSVFDVMSAPTGNLTDASTLGQGASAILLFNKQVVQGVNDVLQLTVDDRNSYSTYANSDLSQGVAMALDTIVNQGGMTNPQLINLLGKIDFLATGAEVHAALESLAPPLNYALMEGSHAVMDAAFESLHERLENLRHLAPLGAETYRIYRPMENDDDSGYSYGDTPFNRKIGAWVKGYGMALDQRRRHQYEGYLGTVSGMAIGADLGTTEGLGIVGGAVSYTKADMKGKTDNQNRQDINSFQGAFYSWFSAMDPFYIDTLVGFSINRYKTRRNVAVGNYSASGFSDFTGFEYGAEIETGYAFIYQTLTVAPILRVKATRLEVGSYTETGMGGTGLAVKNAGLNEFVTGIGFRALTQKDFAQAIYATEFSAMILYDFCGAREKTVSNFLGAGPSFPTQGIKPDQTTTLLGLSFNAYTNDRYSFTLKYELAIRDHFFGNTGYLQLRYQWG